MLNAVIGALVSRGWFDTHQPYEKVVLLTRGSGVSMLLTRSGRLDTHVKFSESTDLAEEARRCAAASLAYPGLAASFVGYVKQDGLDILATRAVEHVALSPQGLARADPGEPVMRGLLDYFGAMRSAQAPPLPSVVANRDLVPTLRQFFAALPVAPQALNWLDDRLHARVRDLPDQPQHGDFVVNNLGLGAAGLVIFDWEDFGRLNLPGLDVYTLRMSAGWGLPAMLAAVGPSQQYLPPLVQRLCAVLGLALADFEALIPLYLLAFRFLKQAYGAEVRARMDNLLSACLSGRSADPGPR